MIIATEQHIHCWIIPFGGNRGACACGRMQDFDNRALHAFGGSQKSAERGQQVRRERGGGAYQDKRTGKWVAYEGNKERRYFGFSHPSKEAALEARRVAMEGEE